MTSLFLLELTLRKAAKLFGQVFTISVSVAGSLALLYSLYRLHLEPVRLDWMLALTSTMLLCWRAEVWIPGVRSKVTLIDTLVCIAMFLLGPWAAAVVPSIDGLARSARGKRKRMGMTELRNMGGMNIAVLSASLLSVKLFGPLDRLFYGRDQLPSLALAIGVITLTNYLVNSSIAATVIAVVRDRNLI